jgi:hypothetical protein
MTKGGEADTSFFGIEMHAAGGGRFGALAYLWGKAAGDLTGVLMGVEPAFRL